MSRQTRVAFLAKSDTMKKEWNIKVIIFILFNLAVIAFYKFSVTAMNELKTRNIKMFKRTKKELFLTEVKTIYKEVSKKYISENMKGNKIGIWNDW